MINIFEQTLENVVTEANFSVQLFQKIFGNCTCFPFSREKIINILEQTLETVATEVRTFRFGFFKKYLETARFPFLRQ